MIISPFDDLLQKSFRIDQNVHPFSNPRCNEIFSPPLMTCRFFCSFLWCVRMGVMGKAYRKDGSVYIYIYIYKHNIVIYTGKDHA